MPIVGERLGSTVCDTEVIVVRPPSQDVDLTCGGQPMAPLPAETKEAVGEDGPGTLVGKRYSDPGSGLELLCTRPGAGQLRVGGTVLGVKQAKNLPSSD
ncbi:hypothetical protein D9V37_14745 [Nocardioides mangrovicus]|uniref:Uncharacterized protein n=1 Tax=Nocardioides mangrovicus TaxID=2478913 RepID=A0A3L8P1M2_9ACTN|nr:hypothetical protein D9V37_14745 [Nocardioides mangrovicus]